MSFKANLVVSVFLITASLLFSQDVSECFSTSSVHTICTATTQTPTSMPGSGLTWGGHCSGVNEIWTNTIRTQNTGGLRFYSALSNDSAASANYNGSYIYTIFDDSFDLGSISIDVGQKASAQSVRWLLRDEQGDWYISSSAVSVGSSGAMSHLEFLSWLKVDAAATAFMNAQSSGATVGIADISTLQAASPDTSATTGGGLYIEVGDTNSSASEYFVLNCITWGQFQELTLEQRVEALPEDTTPQKLKKALLQWALEDALAAEDAGLISQADQTRADVEAMLDGDAAVIAQRQTVSEDVFPSIEDMQSPYIYSIINGANNYTQQQETFLKGEDGFVIWGSQGWHFPNVAEKLITCTWAFSAQQSPLKDSPAIFIQMMRYMEHIFEYQNHDYEQVLADFGCCATLLDAYNLFINTYPSLILPSKKAVYTQAITDMADKVVNTRGDIYTNPVKIRPDDDRAIWVNADVKWMLILQMASNLLDEQSYHNYAQACMDTIAANHFPDGGYTYIGMQNEVYTYHEANVVSILRYYQLTGDITAYNSLLQCENYEPLSVEPGNVAEYYTASSWKQYWNMAGFLHSPEIVASITGCGKNKRIANYKLSQGNPGAGYSSLITATVYDSSVVEEPFDDNYILYDRNIQGARGRFGRYSFAATTRDYGLPARGKENFVGCMVLDEPQTSNWPLNAAFIVGTNQVQVRQADEQNKDNYHCFAYYENNQQTTTDEFASLSTTYRIGGYRQRADNFSHNWKGMQQWILTPERIIGMCRIESAADQQAYSVQGRLKTVSGRGHWGQKKDILTLGEQLYSYGKLRINLHQSDYANTFTRYSYVYSEDDRDKAAEIVLEDAKSFGGSGGLITYNTGESNYYLVEVYPDTSEPVEQASVLSLPQGLLGFEYVYDGNKYNIIHNITDNTINYVSDNIWHNEKTSVYLSGEAETMPIAANFTNGRLVIDIAANKHIVITGEIRNADINSDGEVNLMDFNLLAAQWLKCTNPGIAGCDDLNQGGWVISGLIQDISDNVLPDVSVRCKQTGEETLTDGTGKFNLELQKKPADSFTLIIAKEGYESEEIEMNQNATSLNRKLTPITQNSGLFVYREDVSMSYSLGSLSSCDPLIKEKVIDDQLVEEIINDCGVKPLVETVFRVYFPENTEELRALFLISEHGMGSNMMESGIIRGFADSHQIALVGFLGDTMQRGFAPASLMENILEKIGIETNHPEMASLPYFTFGHSNGTGFSASYPTLRPERAIGWISYHSGYGSQYIWSGVENTPGLIMHGNLDVWFDNGQVEAVQELRLNRDAPVNLTVGGYVEHWPKDYPATYNYMINFMEACIRIRYSANEINPSAELNAVNIESGWLGDNYDRTIGGLQELAISSYNDYSGDKQSANWLPDQTFAQIWQQYINTGEEIDGAERPVSMVLDENTGNPVCSFIFDRQPSLNANRLVVYSVDRTSALQVFGNYELKELPDDNEQRICYFSGNVEDYLAVPSPVKVNLSQPLQIKMSFIPESGGEIYQSPLHFGNVELRLDAAKEELMLIAYLNDSYLLSKLPCELDTIHNVVVNIQDDKMILDVDGNSIEKTIPEGKTLSSTLVSGKIGSGFGSRPFLGYILSLEME